MQVKVILEKKGENPRNYIDRYSLSLRNTIYSLKKSNGKTNHTKPSKDTLQ